MNAVRSLSLGVLVVVLGSCTEDDVALSVSPPRRVPPTAPIIAPPSDFKRLRFGLIPFLAKDTIAQAHQRMAQHLSQHLSLDVELTVGDSYGDVIDRMERGEFDLVELSPLAYVEAASRLRLKCLVQSIADGSASASGYVFVREDSPRRTLEDLKGATFGFVDPMSTTGGLLARKLLKERGFDLHRDLAKTEYLGNHEAVLLAVLEGRVDAGATYQGSFSSLRRTKGIDPLAFRVIAKTARTPRDIFCVRAGLPTQLTEAITASFLSLTGRDRAGREVLGPLNINGFQPADDHSYDEVRAAQKAVED